MPFVLSRKAIFKYPVKVKQPDDSGAGLKTYEFTGIFKRLDQPKIDELIKSTPATDMRRIVLEELWEGWEGVQGLVKEGEIEVRKDLEVTPTNKAVLRVEPGVDDAVVAAWTDAVFFGPAKN